MESTLEPEILVPTSVDMDDINNNTHHTLKPQAWNNNSTNNTNNSTVETSTKSFDNLVTITLIIMLVFAVLAIIVNLLVLVASKFTTAGRHSILVFIRSLCVGDTLIGIYGITKYIFVSEKPQWINCFLPDALLICAFVAENLTFVALLSDCSNVLCHFLLQHSRIRYSKYNSIFLMIYMWNSAFIFAFLPQMGWNNTPYTCAFFEYHSVYYLVFLSIIFFMSILLMAVYSYRCRHFLSQLQQNPNTPPQIQLEVKKMKLTVFTSHIDIGAQVICFLPLIIYILLHCNVCVNASAVYSDSYLLVLLPPIVFKSVIAGVVRGRRTAQIYQVIWKKWNLLQAGLCYRRKNGSSDASNSNAEMMPEVSVSHTRSSSSEPKLPKMSHYRQYLVRQRRAHSVASVGNGLLNAAALATATPLTRKHRFMCAKCGYLNSIHLQPRTDTPNDNNQSEVTNSANKWNTNHQHRMMEEQMVYTQEEEVPVTRDHIKLKHMSRYVSESLQSSFSTEESILSDNLPRIKRRAQSVDSGMGPSIMGVASGSMRGKDSINKGKGTQHQQKVVTFNDAILGDNEVFFPHKESGLGDTIHAPSSITEQYGVAGKVSLINNSIIERIDDSDYIGQDNRAFVEEFHDPDCVIHGHTSHSSNGVNKKPNLLELRL